MGANPKPAPSHTRRSKLNEFDAAVLDAIPSSEDGRRTCDILPFECGSSVSASIQKLKRHGLIEQSSTSRTFCPRWRKRLFTTGERSPSESGLLPKNVVLVRYRRDKQMKKLIVLGSGMLVLQTLADTPQPKYVEGSPFRPEQFRIEIVPSEATLFAQIEREGYVPKWTEPTPIPKEKK